MEREIGENNFNIVYSRQGRSERGGIETVQALFWKISRGLLMVRIDYDYTMLLVSSCLYYYIISNLFFFIKI